MREGAEGGTPSGSVKRSASGQGEAGGADTAPDDPITPSCPGSAGPSTSRCGFEGRRYSGCRNGPRGPCEGPRPSHSPTSCGWHAFGMTDASPDPRYLRASGREAVRREGTLTGCAGAPYCGQQATAEVQPGATVEGSSAWGHVWTAPAVQEETDGSAKLSGAAMYPACCRMKGEPSSRCSRYDRWP